MIGYIKDGNSMKPISSSGTPCGTVISFAGNGDIPVGFLLCNGASVSKNTYPSLFKAIGYTYGGSGDWFNLPNLTDKFIEGGNSSGEVKEAGLPNIEGSLQSNNNSTSWQIFEGTGAFNKNEETITTNSSNAPRGSSSGSYQLVFDASKDNPIYGNSTTVQPPALVLRYIIKAFAGASDDSTDVAITNVANNLNSFKADNDYVVDSGTSTDGTIWYRKWKSGWLEQGGLIPAQENYSYKTVTLLYAMGSTNYTVMATTNGVEDDLSAYNNLGSIDVTWANNIHPYVTFVGLNSFIIGQRSRFFWYVCGQGADEE